MTRPRGRPSIRYLIAFAASSSGNVLETMGTIRPELRSSVIVFHASDRADRGWENNRKLLMLAPFQIRLVTSMVVFLLAAYPNVVRLPSGARISSASLRICPPTIYDKVGPVTVCQTAHALRQPF